MINDLYQWSERCTGLSPRICHVETNDPSATRSHAEMAAAISFVSKANRISTRYLQSCLLNFRYFHKRCSRNCNMIASKRPKHRTELVQPQNGIGKVDEYSAHLTYLHVFGVFPSFLPRLTKWQICGVLCSEWQWHGEGCAPRKIEGSLVLWNCEI